MKFGLILLLFLTACQAAPTPTTTVVSVEDTPQATEPIPVASATQFVPPSLIPSATFTRAPILPSATPNCQSGLRFVEDLTIPDGTIVTAGETVDKQWRVENTGSCNWDERYRLKLISGPALGMPQEQALYPARSGAQAVIRMLLHAPDQPGAYRSAWQAVDPLGQVFGEPIFVDFIIN